MVELELDLAAACLADFWLCVVQFLFCNFRSLGLPYFVLLHEVFACLSLFVLR